MKNVQGVRGSIVVKMQRKELLNVTLHKKLHEKLYVELNGGNTVRSSLIFIVFYTLFFIATANTLASEKIQHANAGLSLVDSIQLAIKENPKLESSQAKFDALAQMPEQAGALPEPRLIFNAVNLPLDSLSLSQTPMTQIQFGVSQNFPFPGKLNLKQNIAKKESLAGGEMITMTRQSIVKSVKQLWWKIFYLDRSLDTVKNNLNLLLEFIDVAETKYTVGKGLQQEVLLAHLELASLEDNQLQIEAMREKAQASFNLLLNRDGNSKVTLDSKEPDSLPELDKLTVLIAKAKESRPEFRKASLNISAAKDRMGLADKEYYPDFQLGAIYGWRQDDTGLASMQLSMNLPFNTENRQDKKRDQRRYEWLQKKYDLQDLENTVEEEIYQALTDYKRSRKQTLIYQDRIIPQATQTVDSMLAGYQVNKVDFLNLLRSQVNLLNFQTQYWLAFSTANQALAALEYAVGGVDVYEK